MKKSIFVTLILIAMMSSFTAAPAQAQFDSFSQYEDVLVVGNMQGHTFFWTVERSFGVYATMEYHTGDVQKLVVDAVDASASQYNTTSEYKHWFTDDWDTEFTTYDNGSYYLAKRDWGAIAQDYIVDGNIEFWMKNPDMLTLFLQKNVDIYNDTWTGTDLLDYSLTVTDFWTSYEAQSIIDFIRITLKDPVYISIDISDEWFSGQVINSSRF